MCVIYVRPRRPVWVGPRLGLQDLQGALPRFWCPVCGTEVFCLGAEKCPKCAKEEKRYVCEKLRKPLRGVYPGEQSQRM